MTRDFQRARVYGWEDRTVAPHDRTAIAYPVAQGMVDAIWSELGLRHAPRVEPLPAQARCRMADANRLRLRLPGSTPSWCLLHELAHSLTSTLEGQSDGHGPRFVGVYVQLLARYLRLDEAALEASLRADGIRFQRGAQPVFCDAPGG